MSIKQTQHYRPKVEYPNYSLKQLEEFGTKLEKYRVEKTVKKMDKGGGTEVISVINLNEAMVAYGAMRKKIHVGVPTYLVRLNVINRDNYGGIKSYEQPTKYDLFMHQYELLMKLRGKKEYAEGKTLEAYEKMAEEQTSLLTIENLETDSEAERMTPEEVDEKLDKERF